MSRHRQPLELARLKGAHKNHPSRYRKIAPQSDYSLGDPPERMSPGAKAVWRELATCALPGTLTGADRFVLEICCTLAAEFRRDPDAFQVGKYRPLVGCLARLGLSPADRKKLGIVPEEANPFDAF